MKLLLLFTQLKDEYLYIYAHMISTFEVFKVFFIIMVQSELPFHRFVDGLGLGIGCDTENH